ncbi:MAG: thiosulfate oxidation carrier protein SoxY, partial [Gammaproteobacteria bacterium]|nr:thiosulfate oxidation carrier protein SoxY [Gammaproteobacteria bacterium]
MSMQRRNFLKGTLAGSAVGVAVGAGLLTPQAVLAAWPKNAFEAKSVGDALSALHGSSDTADSGDIKIKAPDIAENGAVVPITVATSLGSVESISVIAEKNPVPLVASYEMGPAAEGYVSMRIKMGKTSDVVAVV